MRNMLPILMLVLVGCGRPTPKVAPRAKQKPVVVKVARVAPVVPKVDPRTQPHIMKHFVQLDKGDCTTAVVKSTVSTTVAALEYLSVIHCPESVPATHVTVLNLSKNSKYTTAEVKDIVRKGITKYLRFTPMLQHTETLKVKCGNKFIRFSIVGANGVKLLPKPKPIVIDPIPPMTKEEWERRERGE